jgi:hypothetical protein
MRPITEKKLYKQIGIRIDKAVKNKMKRKTTESVIIDVFGLIHWNAAVI